MNASVELLADAGRSNVHIETAIPEGHPSAQILGTGRIGSGTIVDPRGLILTVHYIVLGAQAVKVTMQDGREFRADVVAQDSISGLAVLQISASELPTLPVSASGQIQLGDEVFVFEDGRKGEISATVQIRDMNVYPAEAEPVREAAE